VDDDFNMEKNVIIEENRHVRGQPMWSAYDHAKKHYFVSHPLGNSILGTRRDYGLTRDRWSPTIRGVTSLERDGRRRGELRVAAIYRAGRGGMWGLERRAGRARQYPPRHWSRVR